MLQQQSLRPHARGSNRKAAPVRILTFDPNRPRTADREVINQCMMQLRTLSALRRDAFIGTIALAFRMEQETGVWGQEKKRPPITVESLSGKLRALAREHPEELRKLNGFVDRRLTVLGVRHDS